MDAHAAMPPRMSAAVELASQARLIAALADPAIFGPGCDRVRHLETHISHVLLTGAFAYKIKKPVDLGFLDFTTLARRKFFCDEELRLNRRLAPAIYLDVVAITGSVDRPALGGAGPVVEYAVRMQRVCAGSAREPDADATAGSARITSTRWPRRSPRSTAASKRRAPARLSASPDAILRVARQNFDQIGPLLDDPGDRVWQDALRRWTEREHAARQPAFARRKAAGFVRECHGDLHLNNIAVIDGDVAIFDCIEFSDELRWIDVMSEVAFTTMDLADRGRPDLAHRFVNAYLEITGDYAGLAVFALLPRLPRHGAREDRVHAAGSAAGRRIESGARRRIARLRRPRRPLRAAAAPGDRRHARPVRIRQDHADPGTARSDRRDPDPHRRRAQAAPRPRRPGAQPSRAATTGLYAPDATERTYRRALELAEAVAAAGSVAIVDGTFLKRWQRDLFRDRAAALGLPFALLAFTASDATLRARVAERAERAADASEADLGVLDHQLRTREPLAPGERAHAVDIDAEVPPERAGDPVTWRALLNRLGVTGTPPP